ncbi:GNAT family N-acetyltransferase [Thermodesulfobacteriota bacterium]
MKLKTQVVKAGFADVSLLSNLIRESFRDVAERFGLTPDNCPKHPSNCTDQWIEDDFGRDVTYYILTINGTPQGCVALEKANPEICYIERLGVLPETRRKGFGKALVDHCLLKARTLAVKEISIGIIADDTELKQWYKKMGFVEGETRGFAHLPFLVTFMSYVL